MKENLWTMEINKHLIKNTTKNIGNQSNSMNNQRKPVESNNNQ